jgi:hypothetical protein
VPLVRTLGVLAELQAQGALTDYAVTGAVAALFYVEPFQTRDVDVMVSVAHPEPLPGGLVGTASLDAALAARGYVERVAEGVMVEGCPVQFLPAASALDEASLRAAAPVPLAPGSDIHVKVAAPEYLIAKALSVGRLKDLSRVELLLDEAGVDRIRLRAVIEAHGLGDDWRAFCLKSGRSDDLLRELS